MKISRTMTINDVLKINEEKMLKTLTWLVPALERLQRPHPRRAIVGAVTIEQAARIAGIPLSEFLYALNLAAGESEEVLAKELSNESLAAHEPSGAQTSKNQESLTAQNFTSDRRFEPG